MLRTRQWLGERAVVRGRWSVVGLWCKVVCLVCLGGLWLGFGCTQSTGSSVCGTCAKDERCNTVTKKCEQKGTSCLRCSTSVDCDNDEYCNADNCCQRLDGEGSVTPGEGTAGQEPSPTDAAGSEPQSGREQSGQETVASPDASVTPDSTGSEPGPPDVRKPCTKPGDCADSENCDNGFCTPKSNLCEGVNCPPGEDCNPNNGQCVPRGACAQQCSAGQVCDAAKGTCVPDCRSAGCTNADELCNNGTGVCSPKDCRSNFNCPQGESCDPSTGKCVQGTLDCRTGSPCSAPSCCDKSTGKCTTDCRSCGCSSGKVCNSNTGICQVQTCQSKSKCSSSADCCGRSCSTSAGHFFDKLCRCKTDADCGPRYRCKTSITNKYCE